MREKTSFYFKDTDLGQYNVPLPSSGDILIICYHDISRKVSERVFKS